MLLSDHHRWQYAQYYQAKALPPLRPHAWQHLVNALVAGSGIPPWSVLDYGCGPQAALHHFATYPVQNYDPAIPDYVRPPQPADLVVCWHVLEHVEPECLGAVLAHIQGLAQQAILCAVSCEPSTKVLPDGSPWHTVVQSPKWWGQTLEQAWPPWRVKQLLTPETLREYQAVWVKQAH